MVGGHSLSVAETFTRLVRLVREVIPEPIEQLGPRIAAFDGSDAHQ